MAALSMVVGMGRAFGTVRPHIYICTFFKRNGNFFRYKVENDFCISKLRSGRRDLYWELQAGQVFMIVVSHMLIIHLKLPLLLSF